MTDSSNPNVGIKNPEEEMVGEFLQIAASPTALIKMMPLWKLSRILYGRGQLVPEFVSKPRRDPGIIGRPPAPLQAPSGGKTPLSSTSHFFEEFLVGQRLDLPRI